jgi:hypothetical protein
MSRVVVGMVIVMVTKLGLHSFVVVAIAIAIAENS